MVKKLSSKTAHKLHDRELIRQPSETVEVNTDLTHADLNLELHDKSHRSHFDQLQAEIVITSYLTAAFGYGCKLNLMPL